MVEWVAHLRRFDENATLDRIVERGGLSEDIVDRLALAVRRSHARAPLRNAARAAHELEVYIEQNDAAFPGWPDLFPPASARRLSHESRLAFAVARPTMLARGDAGYVRRGHGDLHLRNIVLIDGEPTLFDAVESRGAERTLPTPTRGSLSRSGLTRLASAAGRPWMFQRISSGPQWRRRGCTASSATPP